MMKSNKAILLLTVQAASLLSSARADCGAVCTTKDPAEDFTVSYNSRCTPFIFKRIITNAETQACLICLYNQQHSTALATIDEVVTALCIDGYAADVFPYAEITRRGAQFDNEHYSGGAEWNYEVQTASGEDVLQYDASRVNDVYYYEAQRKVIEFPESSIESFNPFTGKKIVETIDDLDGCDINAAYCCFAQDRQAGDNNGNCATPYEYNCVDKDPADNTNICYVDHTRNSKASHVSGGFSIYGDPVRGKEAIEGAVHCHGFAWNDDPLSRDHVLRGNLLFYVSMYDHLTQRGYARNIPGSPMCACAENMAVVTRADCTQTSTSEKTYIRWSAADATLTAEIDITDVNFNACQGRNNNNNNLEARVQRLYDEGQALPFVGDVSAEALEAVEKQLVGSTAGKCNAAIEAFLQTKNITRIGSS